MFENSGLTPLENLGEFGFIEEVKSAFADVHTDKLILGIGDDAAVFEKNDTHYGLISTDMLVEGIHFDLSYVPLKHLGYKAVVANISDICAMNGQAEFITVSIALSSKYSLEAMEELYAGIRLACEKYGIALAGGDTSASRSGMVISVSVVGSVKKDRLTKRSGANAGDLVCVSGDLGAAYVGLQVLEREKNIYLENPEIKPDLEGFDYVLERQLKPEANTALIKWFDENSIHPTAMMDISDGLSSELHHICKYSQVGIDIYEEKLPIDVVASRQSLDIGLEPTLCALHGGEDYELLFTVPIAFWDQIKGNADIHIIGHCTDQPGEVRLHTRQQNIYSLKASGWQSFGRTSSIHES